MAGKLYPSLSDIQHIPYTPYTTPLERRECENEQFLKPQTDTTPTECVSTEVESSKDGIKSQENDYSEDGKSTRSGSLGSKDSGLGGEKDSPLLVDPDLEGDHTEKGINPTAKKNTDDIFWKKVVIVFAVLDTLLLVTVVIVWVGIPPHQPPHVTDVDHVCLDCTDVYLTDDDRRDKIYGFEQKGSLCCSTNQTDLIQKYVIKRYKSDQARVSAERYVAQRTAVHLVLDVNDTVSTKRGSNKTLKWTLGPHGLSGNLSISPDGRSIEAKSAGIYYISTKVVFNDTVDDVVEEQLDPMLLQVIRRRSGEEQLLLENKHTHCANSRSKCVHPSSCQGVFRLEGGDRLSVRVRKPCGLVLTAETNYIDVYLI